MRMGLFGLRMGLRVGLGCVECQGEGQGDGEDAGDKSVLFYLAHCFLPPPHLATGPLCDKRPQVQMLPMRHGQYHLSR